MRALYTTMVVLAMGCATEVDQPEGPARGLGTGLRLELPDLDDDIAHEASSLGEAESGERLRFAPPTPEAHDDDFGLPSHVRHRVVLTDLSSVRTDTAYFGGSARSVITYLEVLVEGESPDGLVVTVIFYDELRVPQLWGVGDIDDDGSFSIDVFDQRISIPYLTTCFTGACYAQDMLARRFVVEGAIGDDRSLVVFDWSASAITGSAYVEGWRNTVYYGGYVFGAAPRAIAYSGGDIEGRLIRR